MLVEVLLRLAIIVSGMLVVATALVLRSDNRLGSWAAYCDRLEATLPYVVLLGIILVANKIARDIGPELSWIIGFHITETLYRIDGLLLWPLNPSNPPQVVTFLQSYATPGMTMYFSYVYVYGYVFMLIFPFVAYFVLNPPEPLRRTIVAYAANYLIGVTCYVIFVAQGPRNRIPGEVRGLMYEADSFAAYQFLTSSINANVNVFPSLHTSLAVTVALLAWTTREEYPLWFVISTVLAASVVFATMYLGIHWAADVLAGIALAWVSVRIGKRYEDRPPRLDSIRRRYERAMPARG